MSLYNGPARGGNRGGKDQFNWESVKSDKDREFYLGHSVKATTGRWQKGKDVFWYTREKGQDQAEQARLELQAIKQREEDLMNEAMGLKPKMLRNTTKPKLSAQDMAKITGPTESEDAAQPDAFQDPDAVKGLGYAPKEKKTTPLAQWPYTRGAECTNTVLQELDARENIRNLMSGGGSAGHEVMQGYGIDNDGAAAPTGANGQPEALPGPPPKLSLADLERMQKEQKKKAKKAEKAAKKAKQAEKKAKKQHRHREKQPAAASGSHHAASPESSDHSSDQEAARPTKQRRLDSGEVPQPRDDRQAKDLATRQYESVPRSHRESESHPTDDRYQRSRSDRHDRLDQHDYKDDRHQYEDRNKDGRERHDSDRYDRDKSRHDRHKHDDRYNSGRQGARYDDRRRRDSPSLSPRR